jgi:hypothetical protein
LSFEARASVEDAVVIFLVTARRIAALHAAAHRMPPAAVRVCTAVWPAREHSGIKCVHTPPSNLQLLLNRWNRRMETCYSITATL